MCRIKKTRKNISLKKSNEYVEQNKKSIEKIEDEANLEYLLKPGMKLGHNSYINSGCSIDTGGHG